MNAEKKERLIDIINEVSHYGRHSKMDRNHKIRVGLSVYIQLDLSAESQ